jgi:hypothetical protein
MKPLYGFLYLFYLLNKPSCSQSSRGRHCPTDYTREITRPWSRETGKRAKRAEEQFLREQCIIAGFRLKTHDPPTDFIESCALQVPPFDQTSPFLLVVAASEWIKWEDQVYGTAANDETEKRIEILIKSQ